MGGAYLDFGTPLMFDAVTSESTVHTAEVTSHPVEIGADVSDHVRDSLDEITLEVVITNQPLKDLQNIYGLQEASATEVLISGGKEPVIGGKSLDVPKFRPVPVTPGAAIQAVGNAIRDEFSEASVAQVYEKTEPKTLSSGILVQKWPTKFNKVQDVVNQLVEWKKAGKVGQVITPWKTFPSMVITSVNTSRTPQQGDAALVVITLKEIRLVEAKLVTAPVPTEPRGKTAKSLGRQPTSVTRDNMPENKKSTLKKLSGG